MVRAVVSGTATVEPASAAPGEIAGLFPGYFALVMATAAIAIAAELQSIGWLADALLAVAGVAYVVLVVLYALRALRYRKRFADDLTSHAKGPAFLTIVAGTNVLGSAVAVIAGWWSLAWVLWAVGIATWIVLVYTILVALLLREPKPALVVGINGTWFLFTVATQSVAALGALLALRVQDPQGIVFVSLCAFCLGVFLYFVVVTLVFYRFTFVELHVAETLPPYWISMGAVAITVLAGSNLLLVPEDSSRLADDLAPFVAGLVLLSWAVATFWIPLMVALGVWRHVIRRVPVRYDPQYWALVFPLGMYSIATFRMADALDVDFLEVVPQVALALALVAWGCAALGLLRRLLHIASPAA